MVHWIDRIMTVFLSIRPARGEKEKQKKHRVGQSGPLSSSLRRFSSLEREEVKLICSPWWLVTKAFVFGTMSAEYEDSKEPRMHGL